MTNRMNPAVEPAGPKPREVRRSANYWMVLARPEFARQRLEREGVVFKAGETVICVDALRKFIDDEAGPANLILRGKTAGLDKDGTHKGE